MGNCQAIDNATLVIQHPCGRVEKLYWPVTATEVMKLNPGHYVALLLTTTTTTTTTTTISSPQNTSNSLRITRIKLLRPTDTLILGQVYRLITTQEVRKGLRAKNHAKLKKKESEPVHKQEKNKTHLASHSDGTGAAPATSELEIKTNQVLKHERNGRRSTTSANSAAAKSRAWQPSLQSISESAT